MARQVLENGVILPAEYSDDWYDDMTSNLTKLDDVIGSDSEKLSSADVGAAALSNNYNDLDNLPTIPTVNDATLTIQKNGVDVQTFTANASSNVTANITVPTKTSDLTNDSNFVDTSNPAVSSGITSAKVTDYDTHIADTDIHVTTADKNKWNNQTYVFRYSSTALTASSTNSNTLLDNTDNLKVGDKVIDISGVLFSITAIDTQNSTFTIGTALIDLAQDSDVMHLSGNETASGNKTFADLMTFNGLLYFTNSSVTKGTIPQSTVNPYRIYFGSGVNYGASLFNIDTSVSNTGVQSFIFRSAENVVSGDDARFALIYDPNRAQPRYLAVKGGIEANANNTYDCGSGTNVWKDLYGYHGYFMGQKQDDEYSSNARTNLTLLSNKDTLGVSGVLFDTYRQNTAQGTGVHILGIGIKENSVRYEGCRWGWYWDNNLNGYTFDFKPTTQGTNQALKHNLGTSTDKWSTINGLNPSSLGMPDLSNGVDISSYITNFGAGTVNEYTPLADGWISIANSGDSPVFIRVYNDYGFEQIAYSERNEVGGTTGGTYSRFGSLMIPCIKNVKIYIIVSPSTSVLVSAKFFPCQGNV